jgi:hypothetical protein
MYMIKYMLYPLSPYISAQLRRNLVYSIVFYAVREEERKVESSMMMVMMIDDDDDNYYFLLLLTELLLGLNRDDPTELIAAAAVWCLAELDAVGVSNSGLTAW